MSALDPTAWTVASKQSENSISTHNFYEAGRLIRTVNSKLGAGILKTEDVVAGIKEHTVTFVNYKRVVWYTSSVIAAVKLSNRLIQMGYETRDFKFDEEYFIIHIPVGVFPACFVHADESKWEAQNSQLQAAEMQKQAISMQKAEAKLQKQLLEKSKKKQLLHMDFSAAEKRIMWNLLFRDNDSSPEITKKTFAEPKRKIKLE